MGKNLPYKHIVAAYGRHHYTNWLWWLPKSAMPWPPFNNTDQNTQRKAIFIDRKSLGIYTNEIQDPG
jgi:hypothetical protein